MGSNKFRHNKKRNAGLTYEFLVRKISQSVIEKDHASYKKALSIAKKYYSKDQPLDTERQLFEAVISTRGIKEPVARNVIREIVKEAKNLNHRLIDIKKSNIIKEIHKAFGKEFFSSYRIPEYKAYASIQILINNCSSRPTLNENVARVQLEESLVEYMTASLKEDHENIQPKATSLVYSMAIKKFNERYEDALNESQKRLLKSYVAVSSSDKRSSLKGMLEKERISILEKLGASHSIKELREDKTMMQKLSEAENKLKSLDFANATSDHIEELMLFHKLVEELESND